MQEATVGGAKRGGGAAGASGRGERQGRAAGASGRVERQGGGGSVSSLGIPKDR